MTTEKKSTKNCSEKEIKKALEESKNMLKLVINNVPQHIFWKDTKSVFMGCNENFANTVGFKDPSEIIGKTDFDITDAEKASHFVEVDKIVLEEGKPMYNMTELHKDANGNEIWVNINKVPLLNAQKEIIGILGTFEDITERIKMENRIKKSEEKYRNLIEFTNTAYVILDCKLKILEANDNYLSLIGCDNIDDILNQNPRSWVVEKDISKFDRAYKALLDGEPVNDLEIEILNERNQVICTTMNANIIENGDKKIFCLVRNVSNRKTGEEMKYIKTQKQKDQIRQTIKGFRSVLHEIRFKDGKQE